MKRAFLIAAAALTLSIVAVFGFRFHDNSLRVQNTRYSESFSMAAFGSITHGMTREAVAATLGPPLESVPNFSGSDRDQIGADRFAVAKDPHRDSEDAYVVFGGDFTVVKVVLEKRRGW